MPAVAPLAAILIALMAVLLIFALEQLGKVIAHIFPSSIGVSIASIHPRAWVEAGVRALAGAVKWLLGDVIRPLVNLIAAPAIGVVHFLEGIVNFAYAVGAEIAWLVDHGIPQLARDLRASIAHAVSRAEAYAASAVHAAEAIAATATAALHARVLSLVAATRAYAAGLVHQLHLTLGAAIAQARHDAWGWVSAARHDAAALVHDARVDLTGAINTAEATAAAATASAISLVKSTAAATLNNAEHYTDKALAAAAAGIGVVDIPAISSEVSGLIDDVGSLAGVLGADLPQLGDILHDLDLTSPLTATLAMTDTLALSRVMTRYLRDCGVPNCRNLHQFGNELHQLLDALAGGAFMGLLVALIADPTGTARFLHDDVGPVATDAIDAAKSLLGV